ncbi:hypothetical protein [Paraburkholderia bonniea]|uniref:hypothetical protein n=1 Tax=Paraburkholderia bonniea TaxID=2152891 RepID=UPI001291343A|nr:hypothetical protein [Paraburkholderia bonniea]
MNFTGEAVPVNKRVAAEKTAGGSWKENNKERGAANGSGQLQTKKTRGQQKIMKKLGR